eukprot:TRINITY_DN7914_c0_g1_i1.p1 TRINITY_DN7914_c0_g1~~TRINITY_DN7914_c0_g1_i1.p1  ORF type:complete len:608 (+),score=127.39 TRINITY_DN7914_c0_g1_i1:57-1880(+)
MDDGESEALAFERQQKLQSYLKLLMSDAGSGDIVEQEQTLTNRQQELDKRRRLRESVRAQQEQDNFRQIQLAEQLQRLHSAVKIQSFLRMIKPRRFYVERAHVRHRFAVRIQRMVRGWIARRYVRSVRQMCAQRRLVATEIVETERRYVRDIYLLCTMYRLPLLQAAEIDPILALQDVQAIFGCVASAVLQTNTRLLLALEERHDTWRPLRCLGDVFLNAASELEAYVEYVDNYGTSLDVLARCKAENKAFAAFLAEVEQADGPLRGLDLTAFLIMPIQRLPRYALLLHELLKVTWQKHDDYIHLQRALEAIKHVTAHVDTRKGLAENLLRVRSVQESLTGPFENGVWPLVAPHRRFVAEGRVSELTDVGRKARTLQLTLLSDLLIVSADRPPILQFLASIELATCTLLGPDPACPVPDSFCIMSSVGTFVFACDSTEDKNIWMDVINTCWKRARKQLEPSHRQHRKAAGSICLPPTFQQAKADAVSGGGPGSSQEQSLRERFALPALERLVDSFFCAAVPPYTLYIFSSVLCWRNNVVAIERISAIQRRGLTLELHLRQGDTLAVSGVVNADECLTQLRSMISSRTSKASAVRSSVRAEPLQYALD